MAFALSEVDLLSPLIPGKGQSLRRYQIIYVERDDKPAEYREDLGPTEDFAAPPFRIPSLWEHTVGELKDIAETLRNRPTPEEVLEKVPRPDSEDFWRRYADLQEAIRKKGRNY